MVHNAIKLTLNVDTNMANKESVNGIDRFFKNEYKKLVSYVKKNMRKRFGTLSAEDIVQDVILALLDKLNVDTQIENLTGYIYRSLRNKIIDEQTKVRRQVSIEDLTISQQKTLQINTGFDQADEGAVYSNFEPEKLHDAINNLSADDKYIITVTHFEGKGFKQLSEELNTPIGTLLSRKHRAQLKLVKLLNNNYIY